MTLRGYVEKTFALARSMKMGAVRAGRVLGIVAVMVVGICGCSGSMPENFDCVEEGVLYRSGQPGAKGLAQITDAYGIKTIINLRSEESISEDPVAQEEKAFARAHGIHLVVMSYSDMNTDILAERFLDIMRDPQNHPVLVHCARGRERSGVMAAVYRMAMNDWTPERAFAEMKSYGFKPDKEPEKARYVLDYCPVVAK